MTKSAILRQIIFENPVTRQLENHQGKDPEARDSPQCVTRRGFLDASVRTGVRALLAALMVPAAGCGGFPLVIPDPIRRAQEWRKGRDSPKPPTPEEKQKMEEEQRKAEETRLGSYRKEIEGRGALLLMPGQMLRIKPGKVVEASLMASQGFRLLIVCEQNTGETCVILYDSKTSLSPLAFKPCEDLALTLIGHDPEFGKTLKNLGINRDLIRKLSGGSERHDLGVKISIEPCDVKKTFINKDQEWVNNFIAPGYEVKVTETTSFYDFPK